MQSEQKSPRIRVIIRKRPISKKEEARSQSDIITIKEGSTVVVREEKLKVDLTPYIENYKFNFDGAYDQDITNQDLYLSEVRPLVESAFDGAKVTCFAYGQTGSGKTYTMLGDGHKIPGLYLLAAHDIFDLLKRKEYQGFTVWISFYEIYCGKLFDLLNDRNILFAREDAKQNVNIVGLQEKRIANVQSLMQIISFGGSVRITAQNGTNMDSSRSHAILQITLKSSNSKVTAGKMSFIDLAGSQRAADHADQQSQQTRIDGAQINKSLLALKQCIRALDQNKNHTPFRGSKLTMVLKDSFVGYCRTVMIGNISPGSQSCQNTLNTLKYADRVKQLKKPNKDLNQQFSKLDELSKELMLPRSMLNKQTLSVLEQSLQKEDKMDFSKSDKKNSAKKDLSRSRKKASLPLQSKNRSHSKEPIQYGQRVAPPEPIQIHEYRTQYQKPRANSVLQSPQVVRNREDFLKLSKKHEHYVQMIIEEEEQIMKHHEEHINLNIELIKQEMSLMKQADKVGSDIESYLGNLDRVLLRELDSISEMRHRILNINKHLAQSKRIEGLYFKQSKKYMMEDQYRPDQNLFG